MKEFTVIVRQDVDVLTFVLQDSTTLELHQSFGTDFRTVAACQLKMRDILEKSSGRLHGTVQLTVSLGHVKCYFLSTAITMLITNLYVFSVCTPRYGIG